MVEERIIEKIKKCLALAGNNPNEAEALAAALQAQKLMAKYDIEITDVEDEMPKEEITVTNAEVGTGSAWKFQLALIIAKNFKCKTFCYGTKTLAFYGHKTDSQVAKEVFMFLFKLGHKLAMKERARIRKATGSGDGVYNSFLLGYIAGIKESLEAQSTALMLIVPEDVKDSFTAYMGNSRKHETRISTGNNFNHISYANGKAEGKNAMSSRQLETN